MAALGIDATHVSGICGDLDWVEAVPEAGYRSLGGMIGWCAVSLEDGLRPSSYDSCTDPSSCHDIFLTLEQRLSVWNTNRIERWTAPIPNGDVTIVHEAVQLACLDEHDDNPTAAGCTFSRADIDLYFEALDEALALAESGQQRALSATWSMGTVPDEALMAQWLERIDGYVQQGTVTWATVPQLVNRARRWVR